MRNCLHCYLCSILCCFCGFAIAAVHVFRCLQCCSRVWMGRKRTPCLTGCKLCDNKIEGMRDSCAWNRSNSCSNSMQLIRRRQQAMNCPCSTVFSIGIDASGDQLTSKLLGNVSEHVHLDGSTNFIPRRCQSRHMQIVCFMENRLVRAGLQRLCKKLSIQHKRCIIQCEPSQRSCLNQYQQIQMTAEARRHS